MDFSKVELDRVQDANAEGTVVALRELEDLQLALVGGGMGDVVIA